MPRTDINDPDPKVRKPHFTVAVALNGARARLRPVSRGAFDAVATTYGQLACRPRSFPRSIRMSARLPFAVDPSGWYPSEPPIQRLPDKAHRPEARSGLIEKENQLYLLQC